MSSEYTKDDLILLLSKNCNLLTTTQKDKCIIQLFNHFESKYNIERDKIREIYKNSYKCTYTDDINNICNNQMLMDRLCLKHYKKINHIKAISNYKSKKENTEVNTQN